MPYRSYEAEAASVVATDSGNNATPLLGAGGSPRIRRSPGFLPFLGFGPWLAIEFLNMDKETRNVINDLIETLKDGEVGFKTAAEDVTCPNLKRTLSEYSSQRARFAEALQSTVEQAGEDAETSGSIAGALHRGWINARSAVTTRNDLAVLEECERGEDSAVAAFQDALSTTSLDGERTTIEEQFTQIRAAHDHIRTLRDSLKQAT